jgi:hypothetical protein
MGRPGNCKGRWHRHDRAQFRQFMYISGESNVVAGGQSSACMKNGIDAIKEYRMEWVIGRYAFCDKILVRTNRSDHF